MCQPASPPTPNYGAAATAQGAANKEAALATAKGSNPNIYSPDGSRTVTWDGDQPSVHIDYSPDQRAIYDINQQGQRGLAEVGRDAVGRVGGILGQDVNFARDLGGMPHGRQETIGAGMRRYDTDFARQQSRTQSNLIARGIPRGSEAWNREMDVLERGRNDAFQQATISADAKAMDERRQAITELLAQRQVPLNEISALRSGSQVAPLTFQPYSGATVAPAPIFQAASAQGQADVDRYNAETAGMNSTMNGLFSLGAAGIRAYKPTSPNWFAPGALPFGMNF